MPSSSTTITSHPRHKLIIVKQYKSCDIPEDYVLTEEDKKAIIAACERERRALPSAKKMKKEVASILEKHCAHVTESTETRFSLGIKLHFQSQYYTLEDVELHDPARAYRNRVAGYNASEAPAIPEPECVEVDHFIFRFFWLLKADGAAHSPDVFDFTMSEAKRAVGHWCHCYAWNLGASLNKPELPQLGCGYIDASRARRYPKKKSKKEST
ncbi:hypothetical protein NMY22_g17584 [Coprinellus aureogranulatus]|nr:hypothetical protein NMY22_g17584 [Coprinellus aureogranulatus]